jgi:hypothetical protein
MSTDTLVWIAVGAMVVGSIGGALEATSTPGGGWYKVGVFLASLGADLVSLRKLGGGQ